MADPAAKINIGFLISPLAVADNRTYQAFKVIESALNSLSAAPVTERQVELSANLDIVDPSPTAVDVGGGIYLSGNNDLGAKIHFAWIKSLLADGTPAAESAALALHAIVAGSLVEHMRISDTNVTIGSLVSTNRLKINVVSEHPNSQLALSANDVVRWAVHVFNPDDIIQTWDCEFIAAAYKAQDATAAVIRKNGDLLTISGDGGLTVGDPFVPTPIIAIDLATRAVRLPQLIEGPISLDAGLNIVNGLAGGILTVPLGGTGVDALADHGVLIGSGAAAVTTTGTGSIGQVLTSNGAAADPTFQPAGAGNGITELTGDVTAGPGTGSQVTTIVKIDALSGAAHMLATDATGHIIAATHVSLVDVPGTAAAAYDAATQTLINDLKGRFNSLLALLRLNQLPL